jgi:hypothetical protein
VRRAVRQITYPASAMAAVLTAEATALALALGMSVRERRRMTGCVKGQAEGALWGQRSLPPLVSGHAPQSPSGPSVTAHSTGGPAITVQGRHSPAARLPHCTHLLPHIHISGVPGSFPWHQRQWRLGWRGREEMGDTLHCESSSSSLEGPPTACVPAATSSLVGE